MSKLVQEMLIAIASGRVVGSQAEVVRPTYHGELALRDQCREILRKCPQLDFSLPIGAPLQVPVVRPNQEAAVPTFSVADPL